jgi:hypothetical protein
MPRNGVLFVIFPASLYAGRALYNFLENFQALKAAHPFLPAYSLFVY